MPAFDRTTVISGPAIITYGGQSFWSKGDVILKPNFPRFDIQTSRFGKVDSRFTDKMMEVSFEPDGRFTAALAAVLWPYAETDIGTSIYGSSDAPLVVHGRDGVKITVHNAALTQMPSIRLGVAQTIQGQCTFTGLVAKDTDPTDAAAYYTIASAAYPGDTGWAASDILTLAFDSAWGASPWDDFMTENGWEISFGLQLADQKVDGVGTVTKTLQGLDVTARAIPVGPTMAELMAKMGNTQPLGGSVQDNAADLIVSATGLYLAIYNAAIVETDLGWGNQRKRLGPTTWQATRTVTTGSLDPLFLISDAAP